MLLYHDNVDMQVYTFINFSTFSTILVNDYWCWDAEEFGLLVADINYLNLGITPPENRVFIC